MEPSRKKRFFQVLALFLVLGAALLLLVFWLQPPCLIYQYTGLYCAGCGAQRMVAAIFQGDFSLAFRQNPFLFFVLPLAGVYLVAEGVRYILGKPFFFQKKGVQLVLILIAAAALIFSILRNIPVFSFLGPI